MIDHVYSLTDLKKQQIFFTGFKIKEFSKNTSHLPLS